MSLRWTFGRLAGIVTCCVGVVAICASSLAQGAPQGSKPIVRSWISTEYFAPPPTLREMALAAGAVVRAKVTGSRPRDGRGGTRVETAYSFRVIEVIQNFGSPVVDEQKPLTVLRYGGDRIRDKDILSVYESDFPPFAPGTEYVLFLKWNPDIQLWEIMWGPAGVIQIADARARPWSKAKPVNTIEGRNAAEVLDILRLLKSEGGK